MYRAAAAAMGLAFVLATGCRYRFDELELSDARPGTGADGTLAGDGGPSCLGDLSHVGMGDFEIAFTIRTTNLGDAALLWQRAPCTAPAYWEVTLDSSGRPVFAFLDPVMMATSPGFPVTDGAPHRVVGRRSGGVFDVSIDGADTGGQTLFVSFGQLPPLGRQGHPCGVPAAAEDWVTDVCVRPL